MANFATLANVLAGCATQVKPDACSQFLAPTTPRSGKAPADTLTALEGVARDSSYQPERLFALLDAFYPVAKGKKLRPTPFMPYLTWAPSAWVLPLRFTGGGLNAPGRMMFDSMDALWDGNLSEFAPNGRPLSPITTGFTGGGLEGVGYGLAIDSGDNVWVTTYGSQTIAKFNNQGKPLSPSEGYNFNGQLGLMQGIIVTPSEDVWAVGISKTQLVYFQKGDPAKAKIICEGRSVEPCKSFAGPFHLAIDQQDRIWVSNALGAWLTRFPASDPGKAEVFKTGFSGGGVAIDGQGNVWVANHLGNSEHARALLQEVVKVAQAGGNFDPALVHAMVSMRPGPEGGSVSILRPDGTEVPGSPVSGHGLAVPWALAVDGNDHIWVSNLSWTPAAIVELCGYRTETCPPGMKMGDAISPPGGYVGGLQMQVDVAVDPAGNVWVGNNWDDWEAVLGRVEEPRTTRAGGQTLVVFYGMAKPVRTPMIGPSRGYD
jgi:streptogramin lyase